MNWTPLSAIAAVLLSSSSVASHGHELAEPQGIQLQAMAIEQAVAEFIEICVKPEWDLAAMRSAISSSDLAYMEEGFDPPKWTSARWESESTYVGLELEIPQGRGPIPFPMSQCTVSTGSTQKVTRDEVNALLLIRLGALTDAKISEVERGFMLEWDSHDGETKRRVTSGIWNDPTHELTFSFEDWTTSGLERRREWLAAN